MIRDLIHDAATYALGSLLTKGLSLLLLPLYTYVLDESEFGALELITTLGVLVMLTVALEISQGLARLQADEDEDGRSLMFSSAFWFSSATYGAFLLAGIVAAPWITQTLLGVTTSVSTVRLAAATIAVGGLYTLLSNQLRWELRSRAFTVVSAFYAFVTLVLTVILTLFLDLGLDGALLAQVVAGLVCAMTAAVTMETRLVPRLRGHQIQSMLAYSLPLVPAGLGAFATLYFNRLALQHFGGLAEVATFAVASRLASVVMLLAIAVQAAVTPLVYRHYAAAETPAQLARAFSGFISSAALLCLWLSLAAPRIINVVSPPAYADAASLVLVLAPALLISQLYVFAPGIALGGRTVTQLVVVTGSGLVSVLANILLVPPLGGHGAALATLAAAVTMFVSWAVAGHRHYPVPFQARSLGVFAALFAVLAVVGTGSLERSDSALLAIGIGACSTAALATAAVKLGLVHVADLRATVHAVAPSTSRTGD